jgi:hypothetical protein
LGGLSLCALIRVQFHTKVAHGACKICAIIRVVHLSGVYLTGFRSCTKHRAKVRGMENVCTYPGFTVFKLLGRISTFGNASQAIITATFTGIAQAVAVNKTLDIIFSARSDDFTSFGLGGYTFPVIGTQQTENTLVRTFNFLMCEVL